jgi:hypothetical protein
VVHGCRERSILVRHPPVCLRCCLEGGGGARGGSTEWPAALACWVGEGLQLRPAGLKQLVRPLLRCRWALGGGRWAAAHLASHIGVLALLATGLGAGWRWAEDAAIHSGVLSAPILLAR